MRIAILSATTNPSSIDAPAGLEKMSALQAELLTERGHDVTLFAKVGSKVKANLVTVDAHGYDGELDLSRAAMMQHRVKPYDVLLDNSHTHHLANLYPSLPTLNVYHDVYQKPVRCGVVLSVGQKAAMNMERQKVRVIPNVIQDAPLPNEDKRGDYVLFIGAIDPLKNPLLAIQAAANANVTLVMAGRVSPQFPLVQSPSLRYAGIVTGAQKWRLYYHARAMLQTGVNESFGLTTLESQLMGTPVIGVANGGTPELIRNDETGFLLSTEASIARWGEAIRDIIHLDHTAIRQHALGFTDTDKWIRQYEAALVSVASGDWWGES